MREVYVSGPVIRQTPEWDLPPWIQGLYSKLEELAQEHGRVAILPKADPELERSRPDEFFRLIRKRISHANAVVSVFTAGDVSAAVEASIASVSRKKILLIAEDPEEVPRLVRGLPGVTEILGPDDMGEGLDTAVLNLLGAGSRNGPNQARRTK